MATEGMPPVPPSAGELGGEAALQPTRAALGVLAQLAQGQGTGRQAAKLLQFLRDRGTPALARGLLYDALLAAGLTDEDWHVLGPILPSDIGRGDAAVAPRAASMLAAVTTLPAVAAAAADSPGLTAALYESWEAAADALLASDASVVGAAATALGDLFATAAGSGDLLTGDDAEGGAALSSPARQRGRGPAPWAPRRRTWARSAPAPWPAARVRGAEGPRGFAASLAADICPRLLAVVPAIVARARRLPPVPLAAVPRALVALVLFAEQAPRSSGRRSPAEREVEDETEALGGAGPGSSAARAASTFFADLLASPFAEVVLASASALLCLTSGGLVAVPAAATAAAPAAVLALVGTLQPPLAERGEEGREGRAPAAVALGQHVAATQVLGVLLGLLEGIPPLQQAPLFGRVFTCLAGVPRGADRVRGLASLWASVLAHDWAAQHGGASRGRRGAPPPPPQLQQLLGEAPLREWVAGAGAARPGVFREELVAALLYVLLTHDRIAGGFRQAASSRGGSAIDETATLQTLLSAVEWLHAAVTALKGTKPCLGWTRMSGGASVGAPAVVDLWMQLLLAALGALGAVRSALASRGVGAAPDAGAAPPPEANGRGAEATPSPALQVLGGLHRRSGALEQDLQALMIQARAVLLCAEHLHLRSALDATWTGLVEAVRGLLAAAAGGEPGAGGPLAVAVREGRLSTEGAAEGAARARAEPGGGARQPLDLGGGPAAVASQNLEMALLCLEHLAIVVSYNHKDELRGHLAPVASLLEKLASLELDTWDERVPGVKGRLLRVRAAVLPAATSGQAPGAERAGGLARPDAPVEQARSGAASPEPEAPRALQAALWRGDEAGAGARTELDDVVGLPGLPELASLLAATGAEAPAPGRWTEHELLGPQSPLSLFVRVTPDAASRTLVIAFRAVNRTLEPLEGVEAQVALGGPLRGGPALKFALPRLPAEGETAWSAARPVAGFGWPVVSVSLRLPVKVSLGRPVIRCRPLSLSPLCLLSPPTHAMTIPQFYQHWQSLPHGVSLRGALSLPGPAGLARLMEAVSGTGTLECVFRTASYEHGVHAAFYGSSWDRDTVAVVITGADLALGAEGSSPGATLHFDVRSDSADVMEQVRGREEELLSVLTGGLAVPAPRPADETGAVLAPASAEPSSDSYSFLTGGVTSRAFAAAVEESAPGVEYTSALEEPKDLSAEEALALARTLEDVAVEEWRKLRAERLAAMEAA
ncbi:hypothetical protein QBZ16_003692 [Prototheca wickerhamii]|uniref:Uncharacterized protein n=1 Tax=Prototheca wickerhamii TaxID=3111 RepID=A0AAD9IMQ7_PROWI|nr:hypothetical protein QBZ16_003692 [Prototheca wickerhamii]